MTEAAYQAASSAKKIREKGKEFGTFFGVYLPALVTMIGMLSFLPLGWIVGSTSLSLLLSILSAALVITFLTALSIAKVSSNMKVKKGGIYYILSRSFGIEIGASMGLVLYAAHTIMTSLCIMGVCQSALWLFPSFEVWQLGLIMLFILTSIAYYSASAAIKTQFMVILFVTLSLGSIFVGTYQTKVLAVETHSLSLPFWTAFALFYPALTGIEAGVALSGELKTPGRSIARGSLAVVLSGFILYLVLALVLYTKVPRAYLQTDGFVWQHLSSYPLLITAGFWLAALSSALGCLLSAPRTIAAIAEDGVLPKWLASSVGETKEPRAALLVTSFIASLGIIAADVSSIATILTFIFLIIYGMLNLVTAAEDWIDTPSWRPTFRVHWAAAFLGFFLCLFAMLMIDSGSALLAIFSISAIYLGIKYKRPGHKFDDIRQSLLFSVARYAIYELAFSTPSLRSWRPNFLVLSESASAKSPLLLLADQITRNRGFLTLASVIKTENTDMEKIETWEGVIKENLTKSRIRALVEVSPAKDLRTGLHNIIQNYGCGSLIPNTVVLGECERKDYLSDYIEILRMASFASRNLVIVRGCSSFFEQMNEGIDLWWDDRRKQNTDLMILLAYLLEKNPIWHRASLTLKSIVSNERALEERKLFLADFCEKARLSVEVEVYMNEKEKNPHSVIAESSRKDGLVFFGIRAPGEDEPSVEYEKYIDQLFEDTKQVPFACFVLCRQKIDLHGILI